MSVHRKVIRAYDRRQQEYQLTMEDKKVDSKLLQRKQSGGYTRPGSRNPTRVRSG